MKRKIRTIAALCLVLSMILTGCGKSKKAQCEAVIKRFETSCNALDVKGVLGCLNPTVSDPLKGILLLGETMTGGESAEGFEKILEIIGSGLKTILPDQDVQASEMLSNLQIQPKKYRLKRHDGYVLCRVKIAVNDMEITKNVKVSVVKKAGEWYISNLALADDKL